MTWQIELSYLLVSEYSVAVSLLAFTPGLLTCASKLHDHIFVTIGVKTSLDAARTTACVKKISIDRYFF